MISYFSYSGSLIIAVLMLSTDQCTPYGNLFSCVLILATSWTLNSIHFFSTFLTSYKCLQRVHASPCVGRVYMPSVCRFIHCSPCSHCVTGPCMHLQSDDFMLWEWASCLLDTLMVWSTLLRTRELAILEVIFSWPPHNLPQFELKYVKLVPRRI